MILAMGKSGQDHILTTTVHNDTKDDEADDCDDLDDGQDEFNFAVATDTKELDQEQYPKEDPNPDTDVVMVPVVDCLVSQNQRR